MPPHRTVIACIGNSLAGDDAVGCAVHDALKSRPLPDDARLVMLGLGGIALLDVLAGERCLIVVDAVQFGAAPGTVHIREWEDIPHAGAAVSLHGLGVREAVAVGWILYPEKMPQRIVLVGVEGGRFDLIGEGMTPAVQGAVNEAVAMIWDMIAA